MVVRVQAQDQSWVWLYMVLQLQPGEIPISSNNYIIRYLLNQTPLINFEIKKKLVNVIKSRQPNSSGLLCFPFISQ